ncbi:PEP/pyruvate-binding domain-containing protein [Tistrella mobilis]|uniref:PEP/pyruvate-binding domain-containing protein n=1 Tax=Tistrella mobilis TaxID=171437 RepID=UPI00355710D1
MKNRSVRHENMAGLSTSIPVIQPGAALAEDASAASLGNKAFNLARMAALGLPVPPGFVIGTAWCARADEVGPALWRPALTRLEEATGRRLGDPRRPLLLSVRSGAPVSMPGMMETLLNIGLSDATVDGMLRLTGHPRLVWDAYRRLVAGFGEVVAGIDPSVFDADLDAIRGSVPERALDFDALRRLTRRHLDTYARAAGTAFPQDPADQLQAAIQAVFRSWQAPKARSWRALHAIADSMGTAVTVQQMVFGNAGGLSGAGVGFTRDPTTGMRGLWVDFLFNAQGEDVVAGRRSAEGHEALSAAAPHLWAELVAAAARLEQAFGDMQDIEFTIEDGRLFLLQTRDGKRTPLAAARIALDLLDEGLIDTRTARDRLRSLDRASLAERVIATADGVAAEPIARAASASAGVASGPIALDETQVEAARARGDIPILVRRDAETRDVAALDRAAGLLTMRGARTSHAAVVARQLGKVCLVGCGELMIDEASGRVVIGGRVFGTGSLITLDGNTGAVHAGAVEVVTREPEDLLARIATTLAAD